LEARLVIESQNNNLSAEERQAAATELAATRAKINELEKIKLAAMAQGDSVNAAAFAAALDKMTLSNLRGLEAQLVRSSHNTDLSAEERQEAATELAATRAKINELEKIKLEAMTRGERTSKMRVNYYNHVDKDINPLPQEPIAAH
jgi:hypothetical protein